MAGQQPAWMTEDPTDPGGGAPPPAWMDEDGTFGDAGASTSTGVPKPDVGGNNPLVAPTDWNVATTLAHGASLGADTPITVELLARREAEIFRKNGADEEFIAQQMPHWRQQAAEGLAKAHENYKELSPGTDLAAETAGAIPTTMMGTGLIGKAISKGLETVGLSGLARFLAGTAGRSTPAGAPALQRVLPRLASEATRNTGEGAVAGGMQAGLNPDKPIGDQVREGAAMGAIATAPMQLAKLAGRETFGTVNRGVAQNALDSGVKIPAGQIAQQPAARAVTRSFGGMASQPADVAGIRQQVATQYADIASRAGVHSLAVDPATGVVSGPRLQAALDHQLATTPWHFDPDLYTRLQQVRRQEQALDAVEPHLSTTPSAHPLISRLGHIGLHAGVGAGLTEAALLALQHPGSWPIIAAGAGATAVGRKLGNSLMNSAAVRRLQLNAAARGLTPTEYLGLGNPAIAGGNALMEYYGVHPEDSNGR